MEELSNPDLWEDQEKAQSIKKEKVRLEKELSSFNDLSSAIKDSLELFEILSQENDENSLKEISEEVTKNEKFLTELEFRRMFSNEMDPSNAYLDIQSGSGGTEAQDWAEMIMRMYLKWGEAKGFETEVIELSPGM
ncbi:MAG: hypothetical protein Ct9H90mP4_00400 [Gammaproteobacteria bacterium]|nr:MAG: hypothetical protein Ct9H90mP4_00400 [Gammaproteobacteria bacterium]